MYIPSSDGVFIFGPGLLPKLVQGLSYPMQPFFDVILIYFRFDLKPTYFLDMNAPSFISTEEGLYLDRMSFGCLCQYCFYLWGDCDCGILICFLSLMLAIKCYSSELAGVFQLISMFLDEFGDVLGRMVQCG
jgi:hypothetical protein